MRVIARRTLITFVQNRVPPHERKAVEAHLEAWYDEIAAAAWQTSAELKAKYRTASIVSAERVVFNIKGNGYRLVASISYAQQVLLIKWIGTHQEYDKIDVRQVVYDRRRYETIGY